MRIIVKYTKENYKSFNTKLDELVTTSTSRVSDSKLTICVKSDMWSSLILVPRQFYSPYKYTR